MILNLILMVRKRNFCKQRTLKILMKRYQFHDAWQKLRIPVNLHCVCCLTFSTFNWTVPWLSWLAFIVLFIATVVLYNVPIRYIILAWGKFWIYQIRYFKFFCQINYVLLMGSTDTIMIIVLQVLTNLRRNWELQMPYQITSCWITYREYLPIKSL